MIGENFQLPKQASTSRRISTRIRANGIVAVTTGLGKPVVARINDIGTGGVSFLHVHDREIANSELKMDILIFDVLSDDELLISHLEGQVKSKELVSDPDSSAPIWRFSVEFRDLDAMHRQTLSTCLSLGLNGCLNTRHSPAKKVA